MKKFYHYSGKPGKIQTSKGEVVLGADGSAEVSEDIYDHLMKFPAHKAHNDKVQGIAPEQKPTVDQGKESPKKELFHVPTLEEYKAAGYGEANHSSEFCGLAPGNYEKYLIDIYFVQIQEYNGSQLKKEDLSLLELPALKSIAGKRKIKFDKNVAPEDLVNLIITNQTKIPPPPPPPPILP
jgi:hypothetical protein